MQWEGYVEKIIFRNDDNGYTVFHLVSDDGSDDNVCVGTVVSIAEGELVTVEGEWKEHAFRGPQIQVTACTLRMPTDELAMERYLGSGAIKGIGATLASRIVRRFGADTFRIMESEPHRLAEIKGISLRAAQEIYSQFIEKKAIRQVMLFLQEFGIPAGLAAKIYAQYGDRTQQVLNNNPYRLAEDIQGVGFRTADEIAGKLGIAPDSEFRIRAGILYSLQLASQNGHVYLPSERLLEETVQLLGVEATELRNQLNELAFDKKIVLKLVELADGQNEEQVYLSSYYFTELGVARMLMDLNVDYPADMRRLEAQLSHVEHKLQIHLDEVQRSAVFAALQKGVFLLTGGPGTGKTTTIHSIIQMLLEDGLEMLLAAPTGRAAKRMTEATGMEARTIHRMLEVNRGGEGGQAGYFTRNTDYPLETDVVIVDEVSMVDIFLMRSLLEAIPVGTRLILVGDYDQLPSVGPGNVLRDLLESEVFSTVRLHKVFRQAEQSDIIKNAHKINRGEPLEVDNQSKDFFMLRRQQLAEVVENSLQLVERRLPNYLNISPFDVQVLTPMRKGDLGVEQLNKVLQQRLNPPAKEKLEHEFRGVIFREGDKVMQVKNNYQLEWEIRTRNGGVMESGAGIYNGDLGVIRHINRFAELMDIQFDDDRMVEYPFSMLEELEHAYAITIHKSQGSEYPAVVMPLLGGPRMLMNRNLLYTGVTRAARCVVLVGGQHTIDAMVENATEQKRYTGLKARIAEIMSIMAE